jgi:hypothetical protein
MFPKRGSHGLITIATLLSMAGCDHDSGGATTFTARDSAPATLAFDSSYNARGDARAAKPAGRKDATEPTTASGSTQAEFRHVDFHIGNGIVLHIRSLRGVMERTSENRPVTFDDKGSFRIRIASAVVLLDMASLGHLMNDHVFGYKGAPLKKVQFSIEGDELRQKGVLHKGIDIPFDIKSTLSVTDSGAIRIHPVTIRVFSIGGKHLMNALGLKLGNMIDLSKAHGIRAEGNDLILDPDQLLPPPAIRGRLSAVRVDSGFLVQTFGSKESAARMPAISPSLAGARNYMFFRGGTLRFGKLMMVGADMQIVDMDPSDPFDFSIDRYDDQLVAGYSKNQPDQGLVVYMPDLGEHAPSHK